MKINLIFIQTALILACLLTASCSSNRALYKKQGEALRKLGEAYMAEGRMPQAYKEFFKAKKLSICVGNCKFN